MITFEQFVLEEAKRQSVMWLRHPVTDKLLLKHRTNKIATHVDWMEHEGLIKPNQRHDFMDPTKEKNFDKISRGAIEIDHDKKQIHHEQHSSHWKPEQKNAKKALFKAHPHLAKYAWRHLGA